MLGPNGKPLARRYYSEESGRRSEHEDIIRGYEIKKNRFVEITDEELEGSPPSAPETSIFAGLSNESSIPRFYFGAAVIFLLPQAPREHTICSRKRWKKPRAGIATVRDARQGISRGDHSRQRDSSRRDDAVSR